MVVQAVRRSRDFYRDIDMHGKNILNAGNVGINIGELMKGTNKNVVSEGTLIEGFETIGDWEVEGVGATQEATTNAKQGTYALKLNAVGGGYAVSTKIINQDFSTVINFILWIYVEDRTKLHTTEIFLSSTTNWAKYFKGSFAVKHFHNGWNRMVIDKNLFETTTGENWEITMIRLRVRLNPLEAQSVYLIFDDFRKDYIARPKVILTFDDNFQNAYSNAYPIMVGNGQKGVLFSVIDRVDQTNYMTLSEMNELYALGWDVSNHTQTHAHLTAIPEAQMHAEINNATTWLINNGFKSSSLLFAYPYGEYNQTVINYLKLKGFTFARSTIGGIWQPQLNLSDNIQYQIKTEYVFNTTTTVTVQGWIDQTINQGGLLVLLFHQIVNVDADSEGKCLTSDFKIISDYLKTKSDAGLLDVETFTNYMWEFLY